ncbi:MAG: hypothetical protein J0I79_10170 [Mesorhizobium sp.]|uniref:hypothetical protein n=1 Tax=Mesorhizobium sp. TaxID=1871066 RepID=UPI001AC075F4|nr:hypothetical protein [Mesorhizobium sp.]MBN9218309.1 hypothetical protein [Mesorhizobium sp.]
MNKPIDSAALLSAAGAIAPPANFSVIGHLDRVALRWLAASPLMFAAFGDASGLGITPGGGEAGFANGDTYELRLPIARLDDPALAVPGQGFGSLFLLPCVGEMMRVNGTVREVRDGEIRIAVEECYGHSGNALIRSQYWAAMFEMLAPDDVRAFMATSRFMALAIVDARGRVELSPRDDPAGMLARVEAGGVVSGRPVNHSARLFEVLPLPRAAAMVLVLGAGQVIRVSGSARISDQTAEGQFVFQDETSMLAAVLDDAVAEIGESVALLRLDCRSGKVSSVTGVARTFSRHITSNQDRSSGAALARAAVSVPGVRELLRKGLETEGGDNRLR